MSTITQLVARCGRPGLRSTLQDFPAYADLLLAIADCGSQAAFLLAPLSATDPHDLDSQLILHASGNPRNAMAWLSTFDPALMPLAVSAGANPNQHFRYTGCTPLYVAVSNRDVLLAKRLLALGADPNLASQGFGYTLPIERAAVGNDHAMVSLLLTFGAKI